MRRAFDDPQARRDRAVRRPANWPTPWRRALGAVVLTAIVSGTAAAAPEDRDRPIPASREPRENDSATVSADPRPDRPPTARITGFVPFRNDLDGSRSPGVGLDCWRPWSAGVAIALATCGAIALASRRRGPRYAPVELQIVGRASLTPKHGVYVVRVGRRVLVVGAGPQGPPSLITELDEAAAVPSPLQPEATS